MSELSGERLERLYQLLPAIYRQRDQEQGGALRMLMAGLESEFLTLEADMDGLYANWFIETCDEWVIPYLGDNVGVDGLSDKNTLFVSQRRQVANAIAYRRRKGMTTILERAAQDVTNWYIHAVEYAPLLAGTQHLAHVLPHQGKFVDLHRAADLDALAGPFDPLAHTIDLRQSGTTVNGMQAEKSPLCGVYQPQSIGLFIWRLQHYLLTDVPAGMITREATATLPAACFTFDPRRRDMQLYNQPQPITNITEKSTAAHVPHQISRVSFARDLNAYRERYSALLREERAPQNSVYYGPDRGVCVLLNGKPVAPALIVGADLSRWRVSPAEASLEGGVAIDVALGRLRVLGAHPLETVESVEVNYGYAFSSDLGGGPYQRELPRFKAPTSPYYIYVLKGGKIETLQAALDVWNAYVAEYERTYVDQRDQSEHPPCTGVIHLLDNGVYTEENLVITVPKDSQLVIEAAEGFRPIIHIQSDLTIVGKAAGANLQLNGLLIDGKLVLHGGLNLNITHCTLMPHGIVSYHSAMGALALQVVIDHSIVGPCSLRHGHGTLCIRDSIVDHAADYALDVLPAQHGPAYSVSLERVTVLGKVRVQSVVLVQDTLFTEPIFVNDQQVGVIRFSYVPEHSRTPRREMCQPDLTASQQTQRAVYPLFLSIRYGDPEYAQLSMQCAVQIRRGATEGSEMGAFYELHQVQRQDNLLHIFEEYLPLGLSADVLYVSCR